MNAGLEVLSASLGAAALSTLGAFGLDWRRSNRARRLAKQRELRDACVVILAGANKIALKSATMRANMFARSGFTESLDIVLHHRKPPDLLEISDYMFSDLGPVFDAQATIWLIGDEQLISGAGEVVLAIGDVAEKSTAIPKDREVEPDASAAEKAIAALRNLKPLTPDQESETARQRSIKRMSHQCALFGQLLRKRIGTSDVEAILRSFPGLLDETPPAVDPTTDPVRDI
jgi:hypothetical protein